MYKLTVSQDDIDFENALQRLKSGFEDYVDDEVRSKVENSKFGNFVYLAYQLITLLPDIFYIGIPKQQFPDCEELFDYIFSGYLVDKIGQTEPNMKYLS